MMQCYNCKDNYSLSNKTVNYVCYIHIIYLTVTNTEAKYRAYNIFFRIILLI